MRLLLHHVRGPISFEDLKTVIVRDEDDDILEIKPCSTYTEVCQVLRLLEEDSHSYQAMEEAAARRNNPTENIEYCDALFNNNLLILEDKIPSITGNKLVLYGFPKPVHDQSELTSKDVLRETSYDVQALRAYMAANVPRLTPDQQIAFIAITGMIGREKGGIVFLDAPGGTDKTFLLNLLLAFVRKEKDMAVVFGTEQGHVLKTCKLIVWDEATMRHRNAFHALDKTFLDLRGSSAIMGGATVVLAGDFR
ncbi:ATP-dependent DNA helicase [Trichonephila inaurata madagascariensis]|uniref:ATP-dependent DNA helicase n=1 Tax=Trichonephila inaurata madagascariensis TaxID=2747483 RepID=A0A8X6XHW9_9ARAC|nr:ATP-dependent DNA helicase [Trichonephila inaurata madagascariensis]